MLCNGGTRSEMPYEGQRFLLSPWGGGWLESSDLERCGPPETRLYCGAQSEIVGLHIARFAGMLAIKLLDGIPDSAAITEQMRIVSDTFQRGPNRNGDPATDEGE
jgi:hypothetical protein